MGVVFKKKKKEPTLPNKWQLLTFLVDTVIVAGIAC